MTTRTTINVLIDKAHNRYARCWNTLAKIKRSSGAPSLGKELLEFQPSLCDIMLRLEKAYQSVAQEKERLIDRKPHLSTQWFKRRMRTLAEYQTAITKCLYIGKSLGDSFAWIFYENERPLLIEHLKHREVAHLPPGVGGIGELAFIKNVKGFGRCLIIYHGITTFLRLGDVSLYDFSARRIAAIGELKTRRIDKRHVEVALVLAGWQPNDAGMISGQSDSSVLGDEPATQRPLLVDMPPRMKDRLGRQLKAMALSLEKREEKPDHINSLNVEIHVAELNQLGKKLKVSHFVYQQAGPGLLLAAYKNRPQPLSSILLGRSKIDAIAKLGELQENVMGILIPTRNDNIVYNSSFYYDRDGKALPMAGTVPLFWWPVPIALIRAIVFCEVLIVTIFNPLHFTKKLEDIGLMAELDAVTGVYTVTAKKDGAKIGIENFGYFMRLIQNCLFREDAVIRIISTSLQTIIQQGLPANSRAELQIQQIFGTMPQEFK